MYSRVVSNILSRKLLDYNAVRYVATNSNLAKLRRETGYPFQLCRKALDMHDNDIKQAVVWLREEAIRQGIAKMEKIQTRRAAEGLIGVFTANDHSLSAMLEVNCETDFVSRNQLFLSLTSALTRKLTESDFTVKRADNQTLSKLRIDDYILKDFGANLIVEAVTKLGENIKLSRGCLVFNNRREDGVHLVGYTHGDGSQKACADDSVLLGKYGAIVALKAEPFVDEDGKDAIKSAEELDSIGRKMAQQIIGCSPFTIEPKSEVVEDEPTSLLQQNFVLDEDITVAEFLKDEHVSVLDFERFECGVDLKRSLIGKELSDDVQRLLTHPYRVVTPDSSATSDFDQNRLNLYIDNNNVIIDVKYG